MVRIAAAILLVAVLALVATSILWSRRRGEHGDPATAAAIFALESATTTEVDIATRYAGRSELLDPRRTLPTWHLHLRDQAARVYLATQKCPPEPLTSPVDDVALAKAYAWHRRTCDPGAAVPEDLVDAPPFVHPSGRSYAALALARGIDSPSFVARHERALHVLELGAIAPGSLGPEGRVLATLSSREWDPIARGDRIAIAPEAIVVVERDAFGITKLRLAPKKAWEATARAAALALVPSPRGGTCAVPASSRLCWESLSSTERHEGALVSATVTSAALALAAALVLAIAYVRERRRVHVDRIHVLRTLTHEIRTPAMSLGLDIDTLRAGYDELPAAYQEPVLRISDGIARLHRVLHRSARYMALFETGKAAANLVTKHRFASVSELMIDLSEEWPDGIVLTAESADGAIDTDVEWLSVAVRNLVENACRHGAAPVSVGWALRGQDLLVRVRDAGTSSGLSLRHAALPYHRRSGSPGLGLGLSIAVRVARLLGGELTHEPSPTVFQLRVPTVSRDVVG